MSSVAEATNHFGSILRSLRSVERFAIGRRILSLVALGVLAEEVEPGVSRRLRSHLHDPMAGRARSSLLHLALIVESQNKHLQDVFTDVLVNDALHSRSFAETLLQSLTILSELLPGTKRPQFGQWFSERLDDIANSGPAVADLATPRAIVQLLVEIAEVAPGQSVYDPCVGLGGILSYALSETADIKVSGRDIHPISWAIALLRMTLLGANAAIYRGDSLEMRTGSYDRIVCDPPYGTISDSARQSILGNAAAHVGARRYESHFVTHCAESLNPGGRAAVLVSQSFLARRGVDEQVRRSLLRTGLLEGIIAIPAGVVSWGYSDTTILVLSNSPLGTGHVRMVDATRLLAGLRGTALIPGEQMTSVLAAYRNDGASENALSVPSDRILQTGHYRPAQYFVPTMKRRSSRELFQEAQGFEKRADRERAEIERLLIRLGLRDQGPP